MRFLLERTAPGIRHDGPPGGRRSLRRTLVGAGALAGALVLGLLGAPAGADPAAPPGAPTGTAAPAQPRQCAEPVNPNATPQARDLLCYLYSQYGNHILSGQQESTWVGGPEYEMDYILDNAGKLPAIRGMDQATSDYVGRALEWWNAGGIVDVAYHMGAPTHPDTYEGTQMAVPIDAVLTPGTAENDSFLQRLDATAANLQLMEDAGAAVIFRPFHEAGGTWFWWSKEGGDQYQRLWRYTYDYLTNAKGLDNLLWMFGANGEPDSSFYPGEEYVDIAGADTYNSPQNYDPLSGLYTSVRDIVGESLPIALHENGPIPDPDLLQETGTRWLWFHTWNDTHLTQSNSVDHLRAVYDHDYVITRDELPDFG
ncbi:glycosyl hydrolase [Streptomyces sp. 6N223]|uniref:glycosyl hydrolase n=1 Tax=Streptomyces sp. 6N223 TaxID=3457412 RepID=UPI003FCEF610